ESFLITRTLADAESLDRFMEHTLPACQTRVRQQLALELGAFVRRLHEAGIAHEDFHPGNILVRRDSAEKIHLYLIDLHAVRLRPSLSWRVRRDNQTVLNRWF